MSSPSARAASTSFHLGDESFVLEADGFLVRDTPGNSRLAGHLDDLPIGADKVVPRVSHVGFEDAAEGLHLTRELDELFGFAEKAGLVHEPRRKPHRAEIHTLSDQSFHRGELLVRRPPPLGVFHDSPSNPVVTHVEGDVGSDALSQVGGGELSNPGGLEPSVRPADHRRDAHPEHALVPALVLFGNRLGRVAVDVDEPGATTRSVTSSLSAASDAERSPTRATLPSRTPTSARTPGVPVPSMTVPPVRTTSKRSGGEQAPRMRNDEITARERCTSMGHSTASSADSLKTRLEGALESWLVRGARATRAAPIATVLVKSARSRCADAPLPRGTG